MPSSTFRPLCLFPATLAFCLSLLLGCHSPHGASPDAFASVIITNHTRLDISEALTSVFTDNGYQKAEAISGPDLTFEKEGTKMNTLMYGGWLGNVWVRVKVYLESAGPTVYLVRCDAFMVGDHDTPFAEEEHKLTKMRRQPYQQLLDETKSRLSKPSQNPR